MKLRIRSVVALVAFVLVAAAGCLKDKDYDNGSTQSVRSLGAQKIIELSTSPHDTTGFLSRAYPISNIDTTIDLIPVTLASSSPAPEDIHVTLALSQPLLDAYNDTFGTSYYIPDPSIYTLLTANSVVTIPKGSNVGYLQIKFVPTAFISDSSFAFPYVITAVDKPGYIISGNFYKAIAAIGPKNKYDGLYSLDIETDGWSAYGISDGVTNTWPTSNGKSVGMITSGPASVKLFDFAGGGGFIQPAFSSALAPTVFGATAPQFTFDLNTNLLVSVNNTAADDGRGRAFHLNPDPADTSRYDPATGTIYAAYIMTQNGRPQQFIYDTLVYTGSRYVE
jgi:hypothetical protein